MSFFRFVGMILTVQPWSDIASGPVEDNSNSTLGINPSGNNKTDINLDDDWVQHYMIGYISVVINILLTGVFLIFHKQKLADLDVVTLVFWATALGIPMSAVLMFAFEYNDLAVEWNTNVILLVMGNGVGNSALCVFSLLANEKTSSSIVQLTSSLHLVLLLIGQYTVLKEINPGHQNALEILGVTIVFIGSCFVPLLTQLTDYRCLKLEDDDEDEDEPVIQHKPS